MTGFIIITIASAVIGLTVSYMIWQDYRVWSFREDLFAIRVELWNDMRSKGKLDSEDHREARECINGMLRTAPLLSPLSLAVGLSNGVKKREKNITDPDVLVYLGRVSDRAFSFVWLSTFSGVAFGLLACGLLSVSVAKKQASKWVNRLFYSDDISNNHYCAG